jgi:hypothetical protein
MTLTIPLASLALTVLPPQPSEDRPLAERFANPPPSARILPIIHSQKDDPAEQDKQLASLVARGFGGFAGNVSFDGYVEDETRWPPFLRGVEKAKAAGLSLWLYDERGYPSGSAGDLTLRGHPEWAARGLLVAETNVAGGAAVSLPLPPGRLVCAAALPRRNGVIALDEAVDLTASVVVGRLSWQAPRTTGAPVREERVEWYVTLMTDDLIYEGTHAAVSLAYKKPCIDLLIPEPTARFLEVTHEAYAARLGNDLGKYFVSTFTDEPSLQNLWFRPMPWRVLPWSLTLEQEFKKRRGRALRPLLPALVAEAGPAGAKARYDFWNTIGELVSENYFGQIQTWCRNHNLLSGGHLLMEEGLVGHVPLYGDFFRCVRRLDAPSIDCLTSLPPQVPWFIARMIGSVADLEGRAVTMCEVSDHSQRWRQKGDTTPVRTVTEDEIRGTCNRLAWGGINTLTSYYSFDKLTDEQLRRINAHVGRCQTMLRGGHSLADIAVLYPVESVWSRFVPAYRGASDEPAARRVESVFDGVSSSLYGANRDFTYVDARALREARADGGFLRHGALRWRALILPAADTLPLDAWKTVQRFWRDGGIVVAIGALPANAEDAFPSPRVQAIARELFGAGEPPSIVTNRAGGAGIVLPAGMTALVPKALDALLERDAFCELSHFHKCDNREDLGGQTAHDADGARNPVKITRRRIDRHDVYFAINDGDAPWSGTLRFRGGVTEQWDPATGAMTPVADGTRVPLRLGPYGAMFFRAAQGSPRPPGADGIARDVPGGHAPPPGGTAAQGGPRPPGAVVLSIACELLPDAGKPSVGKGTHVRSDFSGDDASGWRASATLTQGQVDTHLFISFNYAKPLDLTRAEGLAFDTSVPDGQRTSAELLVFVNTSEGGRYLAGTGRFLNESGAVRAYALFSQFRPFGDTRGPLDLSKVTAIQIGWGGYFGREGERIDLTVKPPQRFVCGE